MKSLAKRIMEYAEALPEATPICSRRLLFGKHPVELRHAPRWQLAAPHRMAGVVIRALAWLGPHEIEDSLDTVLTRLTQEDLDELAAARAINAPVDGGAAEHTPRLSVRHRFSISRSKSAA